ncbi:polysaccharide deacetylase family protein [Oceanospirillum sp. HFRX-1_2]
MRWKKLHWRKWGCLLVILAQPLAAQAAGPEKIATLERALWPETINSAEAFDRASQAEILTFARLLEQTPLNNAAEIQSFTGLKNVNPESVNKWLQITRERLRENYAQACGQCELSTDWQGIMDAAFAAAVVNKTHRQWQQASEGFHRRYLYEQVRLAALFPRITSEIDTFSPSDSADGVVEITGFELSDRHFMLSYDDGPSSTRTAPLVRALEDAGVEAYFFVLGEKLAGFDASAGASNTGKSFYGSQCLASHGYQHKSHQKWAEWQTSLQDTRKAINAFRGEPSEQPVAFRPPYGQRHQELVNELAQQGEKLILWNIDSQDWNRKLSAEQVQDRVLTLMLLWRRGVILYHDIHPKAEANLPALLAFQQQAGLIWQSCNTEF